MTSRIPYKILFALKIVGQDSESRSEVANSLQAYRQFTPDELEQIAKVLESRDDPRGMDRLLWVLNLNKQRPGGQEALLQVARSGKVWLWWPTLQYLTGSGGLTLGQLPPDLQVKYLVQTNPELGLDAAMATEARALLALLPTAKLATMSTSTLSEVMRSTARNLPREEAQAVFLNLLQDMVDHWGDYQFERYSPSKWWAIDRVVRYLNNWNGLNLGGVGQDVNDETDEGKIDWPALAKEVLMHFGRMPATGPATQVTAPVPTETEIYTFTLVDALGQPIPEATLDLQAAAFQGSLIRPRPLLGGPEIHTKTDSHGRFTMGWPARTEKQQVHSFTGRVSHPDYGAAAIIVYAGNRVTEALLVKKGSPEYERALKGQVVDEAGRPVAGALVESNFVLSPVINGQGNAITDSTGRFVMPFVPYSADDKAKPLPSDAEYDVVARAPEGTDLFPARTAGRSPMQLVLRTPTLEPRGLRFEVGDDQYARDEELDCIRLTWVPPGINLEPRYLSDKPVRLIPGQYRAMYSDGHKRSFEYIPVEIDDSSPKVITFHRPPAVTFHGQVVDGITGEPVVGAFAFTYGAITGNSNLAMLFEQDWRELEAMPEKPSPDDPGIKALSRHYLVESLMRTNAEGRFELMRGREQRAAHILVFAKNRLPMKVQLSKLGKGEQRMEVPKIPLFPAAYVQLRPQVPVGARVSVYPQWEYQAEGQPKWFEQFQEAMKDASFPHWLDISGPVRIVVPAQIALKLRFHVSPDSLVAPKANEEILNLAPGETKDMGVLEFVPYAKPLPATNPATQAPAPKVFKTMPIAFSNDVDPALDKITVTFDQPMMDKRWAFAAGDKAFGIVMALRPWHKVFDHRPTRSLGSCPGPQE